MAHLTLRAVNAAIKKAGGTAQLIRGDGYFYFAEGEADYWDSPGVYTMYLNDLSLERWIEEYENRRDAHAAEQKLDTYTMDRLSKKEGEIASQNTDAINREAPQDDARVGKSPFEQSNDKAMLKTPLPFASVAPVQVDTGARRELAGVKLGLEMREAAHEMMSAVARAVRNTCLGQPTISIRKGQAAANDVVLAWKQEYRSLNRDEYSVTVSLSQHDRYTVDIAASPALRYLIEQGKTLAERQAELDALMAKFPPPEPEQEDDEPVTLKRGAMPPRQFNARIRGDAGTYEVWGFDWYEQRVLIQRASGMEWVARDKVQLIVKE